ncbi:hypothetical protein K0M31_010022 [Melipona bicolor]|uniref:Uncharacterized protein n=1 Tax=Melipona bicolor TaxID=60889 RepID=A0AA40FMX7_9HYME|nr:hypothetical protein K0M31_010022 [Melipona bicolor]
MLQISNARIKWLFKPFRKKNDEKRNAVRVIARSFPDTGRDSPPEPAPPEVPPRGPSLHATHTLRTQQSRNGCPPNTTGNFTVPTEQMQSEKYSAVLFQYQVRTLPILIPIFAKRRKRLFRLLSAVTLLPDRAYHRLAGKFAGGVFGWATSSR